MTTTAPADASAARARTIQPAMRAAVGSPRPAPAHAAEYHFGWVDPDGTPIDGDGGKGVRPASRCCSAEAAGADGEVGVPGRRGRRAGPQLLAAPRRHHGRRPRAPPPPDGVGGVRLGDGDPRRRRPAHARLPGAARRPGEPASARRRRAADATARDDRRPGRGHRARARSRRRRSTSACAMAANKTGALLSCAGAIGAILAGARPLTGRARSSDFGARARAGVPGRRRRARHLGRPGVTGKPVGSDLPRAQEVAADASPDAGARRRRRAARPAQRSRSRATLRRRAADLVDRPGGRHPRPRTIASSLARRRLRQPRARPVAVAGGRRRAGARRPLRRRPGPMSDRAR